MDYQKENTYTLIYLTGIYHSLVEIFGIVYGGSGIKSKFSMFIEVECLERKKEFFLSLLNFYHNKGNVVFVQINRGIRLIQKIKLVLQFKMKFVWTGLIPVPLIYFKLDPNLIFFLEKNLMEGNIKWNIINHNSSIGLAFNYYDSNRPVFELPTHMDYLNLIEFLNMMKKMGVITDYYTIDDDD